LALLPGGWLGAIAPAATVGDFDPNHYHANDLCGYAKTDKTIGLVALSKPLETLIAESWQMVAVPTLQRYRLLISFQSKGENHG
jgi:hypothetical protein